MIDDSPVPEEISRPARPADSNVAGGPNPATPGAAQADGRPRADGGKTAAGMASEVAADPRALTAEEQLALYENDLLENDWGHQPC